MILFKNSHRIPHSKKKPKNKIETQREDYHLWSHFYIFASGVPHMEEQTFAQISIVMRK